MEISKYARDVLTFPLSRHALPMLVIGTVISAVMNVTAFAGILGFLASIIWAGYLCATFFSLMLSATNEHGGAPEFADASNVVEDVLVPLVRVVGVFLLSIAPLIIYWLRAEDPQPTGLLPTSLTIFAIVYFPMAILAVGVLNNATAANPWLVAVSIVRTLPYYALCVALIAGVYHLGMWLDRSFDSSMWIAWSVTAFTGMFTIMATARALGLLYRIKEDDLCWV